MVSRMKLTIHNEFKMGSDFLKENIAVNSLTLVWFFGFDTKSNRSNGNETKQLRFYQTKTFLLKDANNKMKRQLPSGEKNRKSPARS